jgi:branched-chain amino acid transport system ATP-binding protein
VSRLAVTDLRAGYGRQEVLHGISMTVGAGEAVAVLGANGAGKSTLMKVISGSIRPRGGEIEFEGRRLRGGPSGRVRQGLVQVAEGHQIIGTLTVAENLALGGFRDWPFNGRRERKEAEDRAYHLFPILAEKRNQVAGLMSGGQQQMLAIARGLMARPTLLLLDEPSLGLAPVVVAQIYERLAELKDNHLSMVIVEQNSDRAMAFCDRTYVVRLGEVVLESAERELSAVALKTAYFGA